MSYDLNGTSQYFTFNSVGTVPLNTLTVGGWFAPDFDPSGTTVYRFWDFSAARYRLLKSATTNIIQVFADSRTNILTATGKWIAGEWHYFLVTINKATDTLDLYIDGELLTASKSGTWGSTAVSGNARIGADYTAASFFDGKVALMSIWNRVLSLPEIQDLSRGSQPGWVAPSGLVALWPLAKDYVQTFGPTLTATDAPTVAAHPKEIKTSLSAFQIMQKCYDPAAKALRIV